MSRNLFLEECGRQGVETLALQAIKLCIDGGLTREEMTGIYEFLLFLKNEKDAPKTR